LEQLQQNSEEANVTDPIQQQQIDYTTTPSRLAPDDQDSQEDVDQVHQSYRQGLQNVAPGFPCDSAQAVHVDPPNIMSFDLEPQESSPEPQDLAESSL